MSYNKHLMDKPDAMKRVTVALLDGTVYQGSLNLFEHIVNLVLLA
jgi:small nuclear ribonucleoprotein (snRNP)-like protein